MVGLKSNDWDPGRKRSKERHRKEGNVNTGQRLEWSCHMPGATRSWDGHGGILPSSLQKEHSPADTLSLDF